MSKSETRKTTKMLSFRLTPDEHAQLIAVAAVSGVGLPTFVRRAAFASAALPAPAYEGRRGDKMIVDYTKILGAVGKIGNNLNQLSRLANSKKSMPEQKELRLLFAEIRALRQDIMSGAFLNDGGA